MYIKKTSIKFLIMLKYLCDSLYFFINFSLPLLKIAEESLALKYSLFDQILLNRIERDNQ